MQRTIVVTAATASDTHCAIAIGRVARACAACFSNNRAFHQMSAGFGSAPPSRESAANRPIHTAASGSFMLHLANTILPQYALQIAARSEQQNLDALFVQIQRCGDFAMRVPFHVGKPQQRTLSRLQLFEAARHIAGPGGRRRLVAEAERQRPKPLAPLPAPPVVDRRSRRLVKIGFHRRWVVHFRLGAQEPQVSLLQQIVRRLPVRRDSPDVAVQSRCCLVIERRELILVHRRITVGYCRYVVPVPMRVKDGATQRPKAESRRPDTAGPRQSPTADSLPNRDSTSLGTSSPPPRSPERSRDVSSAESHSTVPPDHRRSCPRTARHLAFAGTPPPRAPSCTYPAACHAIRPAPSAFAAVYSPRRPNTPPIPPWQAKPGTPALPRYLFLPFQSSSSAKTVRSSCG